MLGLGMALPYLVVAWLPVLARWMPRPGAWMETFRRAMAFPMFATVVWLVWVLGQQTGVDGAAGLLALLVASSMLVWSLTLMGRTRRVLVPIAVAGAAIALWAAGGAMTTLASTAPVASDAMACPCTCSMALRPRRS